MRYLGATPLTGDGGAYSLAAEGVRDPLRGSAYAPIWPPLPVPGSPMPGTNAPMYGAGSKAPVSGF